ncbi:ankyrin repeat protein [Planoprotostelium fungivorum]|uniref:Ankyrin repeat protein n=1 Tax=Planoprotostelium fungivorum TaxID=1890364 RepID=A0A2P6NV35_9EUKA|nr:ankyrin repeat protein [Planoprotostelium fungivorum]
MGRLGEREEDSIDAEFLHKMKDLFEQSIRGTRTENPDQANSLRRFVDGLDVNNPNIQKLFKRIVQDVLSPNRTMDSSIDTLWDFDGRARFWQRLLESTTLESVDLAPAFVAESPSIARRPSASSTSGRRANAALVTRLRDKEENDALEEVQNHSVPELVEGDRKNRRGSKGATPLMLAVGAGDSETVKKMLDAPNGPDIINQRDYKGRAAVHYAVYKSPSILKLLLSYEHCDANIADDVGATPLMLAAVRGDMDSIVALTEWSGIDVDKRCDQGYTALHYAVKFENHDALELLLGNDEEDPNIRASPGIKNNDGTTPLMLAVSLGQIEMVDHLLREMSPEDIFTLDEKNRSAYDIAVMKNFTEIALHIAHVIGSDGGENSGIETPNTFFDSGSDSDSDVESNGAEQQREKKNGINSFASKEGNTLLHYACLKGDKERTFQRLINRGINVDVRNMMSQTPLHLAAKEGQDKCVITLLNHKATVDAADNKKRTPLHYAARYGHKKVVRILLSKGAKMYDDIKGCNPLHYASRFSKEDCVEAILEKFGREFLDRVDKKGRTAIHFASMKGGASVVKHFIGRGARVDIVDHFGKLALHYSAKNGDNLCSSQIMSSPSASTEGILDVQDQLGRTPLFIASLAGHAQLVKTFVKYSPDAGIRDTCGRTPLHAACNIGHRDKIRPHLSIVRCLLDTSNPNAVESQLGRTPLYYLITTMSSFDRMAPDLGDKICNLIDLFAEHRCRFEKIDEFENSMAHLLANKNVMPGNVKRQIFQKAIDLVPSMAHLKNKLGRTPLHEASTSGDVDSLEILFKCTDIDINVADPKGRTPIHIAALSGQCNVLQLLIQRSNHPDAQDDYGRTALHYAAYNGSVECVNCLLKRTKLHITDNRGRNALHAAASKAKHEVVALLLKSGMDVNVVTLKGQTPLTRLCIASADDELTDEVIMTTARILLSHHCMMEPDEKYGTPLMYAAAAGRSCLVKLLLSQPGCKLERLTKRGKSAMDFAKMRGHDHIVRIIEESTLSPLPQRHTVEVVPEPIVEVDDVIVNPVEEEISVISPAKEDDTKIVVIHSSPIPQRRSVLKGSRAAEMMNSLSPAKTEARPPEFNLAIRAVIEALSDDTEAVAPWSLEPFVPRQVYDPLLQVVEDIHFRIDVIKRRMNQDDVEDISRIAETRCKEILKTQDERNDLIKQVTVYAEEVSRMLKERPPILNEDEPTQERKFRSIPSPPQRHSTIDRNIALSTLINFFLLAALLWIFTPLHYPQQQQE